ncbi:MAG: thermostable hemolysin [Candidatus Accumulibacter sp.]|jgi:hypothetical protein|nr:thermostable hemolysin [Accumulibacter sp.]
MQTARRNVFDSRFEAVTTTHTVVGSPRREETESFIRTIFARHHGADVTSFAPNLLLLEQRERIVAATGWRAAQAAALFLECYLEQPIEQAMADLAHQRVRREEIVEVGNLAAEKPGGTVQVVLALAAHLDRLGYKWVVFTATRELIGIFNRLGLPLLALATADPGRLGEAAATWGRYYDTQPIVVAGRIRMALERIGQRA